MLPRIFNGFWIGAACLFFAGCSSGDKVQRCDVSGNVTYDGAPLAAGRIYFAPDASKQNTGPEGVADIKDGHFDTRAGRGKGGPGGPVVVMIQGFDGQVTDQKPMGNAIFKYETKVELPRETATKDFDLKPADVKKIAGPGIPH